MYVYQREKLRVPILVILDPLQGLSQVISFFDPVTWDRLAVTFEFTRIGKPTGKVFCQLLTISFIDEHIGFKSFLYQDIR